MEENNRPGPQNGGSEKSSGENRNRRRGHRGGKKHNKKRIEGVQAEVQGQENHAPASRDTGRADKQEHTSEAEKPRQTEKAHGEKKKNHDRRGNRRRGDRHHGAIKDHIEQKDDIYGDPKEERELAEWRSKIVLNAPTLQEASPSSVTEEVELPEGIDLLGDSIAVPQKSDEEQVEVIGVRFRSSRKIYFFSPNGLKVKKGEYAIVETARCPEYGEICLANTMVDVSKTVSPLRPLVRIATAEDIAHNAENVKKEREALDVCQKKIAEHKLDMKLIDVQYAFDNSKLLFYFSSEGRVDFRELVRDLASVFRTRIELRQIGIRDEAKMLGGLGACGRMLCCSTFLPDFAQVSIKMAKDQGLSLNSAKISGMCGRLMCCLRFESDIYTAEHRLTPPVNSTVRTEDGVGKVISTNPLAGTLRVVLKDTPDAPPKQYHRDAVTVLPKEKDHNS